MPLPDAGSELRAAAVSALDGRTRQQFLADLGGALCLAARGEYAEAGNDAEHTSSALRAINEMSIVIAAQLRSALRDGAAYPDRTFVDVLVENAHIGHVEHVLSWALQRALGRS